MVVNGGFIEESTLRFNKSLQSGLRLTSPEAFRV